MSKSQVTFGSENRRVITVCMWKYWVVLISVNEALVWLKKQQQHRQWNTTTRYHPAVWILMSEPWWMSAHSAHNHAASRRPLSKHRLQEMEGQGGPERYSWEQTELRRACFNQRWVFSSQPGPLLRQEKWVQATGQRTHTFIHTSQFNYK